MPTDDEGLIEEPIPAPESSNRSEPSSRALAEAVRSQAISLNDTALSRISGKRAFEPEGVHEIRLACKRLRALWQLMRPVIEPQIARSADIRLRDVAEQLSEARDMHVLSHLLFDLRDTEEALYRDTFDRAAKILALTQSLEIDEQTTRSTLLDAFKGDHEDWHSLVLPDNESVVEHGLGRTYRKARRRADTVRRTSDRMDQHRWRKWAKYLRYQLEAMGDPTPALARRLDGLRHLGSALGKRNDLHNLRHRLEECHEGDPFGAVFRSIEMRDQALGRRMAATAGELFSPTPEKFVLTLREELAPDGGDL